MKVRSRNIEPKEKILYLDTLYTALESLQSREELTLFLRDLLTEGERIMIGRRILIAQRLLENQPYDQIIKEMHVGADTIMRVHRWLDDENKGYEKAVENLKKQLKNRKIKTAKRVESGPFARLRYRYPLHFLLFNIFHELNKK